MFRLFCISLLMLMVVTSALAQTDSGSNRLKFQSVINVGLANGGKGSSMALQAIAGAALNHSFAGLGIGLDYYRFRSVPLFINLRQEFGKGNRNIFLYGDAGYNFDWLTDKDIEEIPFFADYDFKEGVYYEGGLGHSFKLENTNAILLSFGYSYKQLRSTVGNGVCPLIGPCFNENEKYAYGMPRWMIKAGWRF